MHLSLLHHDGKYKNQFIFPFCHFVVLSNISRDNIERLEEVNLYEIFKPENTIYRDQMVNLKDASPRKIRSTLVNLCYPFWAFDPLSDEQVNVLRSIIDPYIVLEDHTPRSLAVQDSDKHLSLQVLDKKQENNALRIGDGHRIIYGVAGSGKTVLLVARCKILHDRDPEATILLLCYNVALSVFPKRCTQKISKN